MPTFDEVTHAWDHAEVEDIHPLRRVDVDAYWESGRAQSLDAAQWIPEGGTVIDFGCGDGRGTIPLAKLGFHVIAVDASQTMLDRLVENAMNQGYAYGITTHRADHVDPDVFNGIDAIVARAVLIHHSHEDVAQLVNGFAGALKPGGHLVTDWPTGAHYERQHWTDVTTWSQTERARVAEDAGFGLVKDGTPTVWVKR